MIGEARGDPRTLDGPWMTEALERAGVAGNATVVDVRFDGFVGTGQMSRNARFALTWDDPHGRPATVIGKFPTDDPPTRASSFESGVYFSECSFYDELAATVDIRTPACWVARFDAGAEQFVLIMEDMAGSVQGNQFTGCTRTELSAAIEQAAALHAPRWGDRALAHAPALQPADEARADLLERYYGASVDGCLKRLGHRFQPDEAQLIRDFAPLVRRWTTGTGTPHTIVHGDFRPDNFLLGITPDAPPLAVVDWQTIFKGLGVIDIAYLVGGSFEPADRRASEHDLLDEYRAHLRAAGIDYASDDCWRDYRWGTLHGVLISVCAAMMAEQTERGDDMLTLMATRHARHALDLDALGLLINV